MKNDVSKKAKSSREKRVLIGSLCIAAAVMAGSTFAWFSSKDEVTNRLSASAAYDVSIAEDFQPTEDWIPGQTINKDVSAVNTGNIDAFVRMWLGGQMRILTETSATDKVDALNALPALTEVTDVTKKGVGLNYYDSSAKKYYKTLSTEKIPNPNDLAHAGAVDEEANQPARLSEVQSMMAGGVLVYATAGSKYHWTLEQATELPVYEATNPVAGVMTNIPKGTVVGNSTTGAAGATKLAQASTADTNYYGSIDASTFTPETTGLYLFRRNVGETADGTANTYEYSGYYYDATLGKYFALYTGEGDNKHSDYVLPSGSVTENNTAVPSANQVLPVSVAADKVYLYTASEVLKGTDELTWTYDNTAGSEKFTVSYAAVTGKPVSVDIALANIGSDPEKWTAITDSTNAYKNTFYYNNDVEAGDTTTKLVDSVKLADTTANGSYLAFDFDLDVYLESVQVTMDDEGKELTTPVNTWAATTDTSVAPAIGNTGAKPSGGNNAATYTGGNEISVVGWTAIG